MHSIARNLRQRRFASGALRLDNTKLTFSLDTDGNPVSFAPYVQREANQMIEEFMLLANMAVARYIANVFPDRAMLRRHPEPNKRKMKEVVEAVDKVGFCLDHSSAGVHSLSNPPIFVR